MSSIDKTEAGMPDAIQINHQSVQRHVDQVVRQSVEDTLNQLLDAEADALCQENVTNARIIGPTPGPVHTRGSYRRRPVR